MNAKLLLLACGLAAASAVPVQALGESVRTIGSAAVTAAGITAAAKPLVVLGLGKYALWNWLNQPGNHVGFSVGYRAPNAPGVVIKSVSEPEDWPVYVNPNVPYQSNSNSPVVTISQEGEENDPWPQQPVVYTDAKYW